MKFEKVENIEELIEVLTIIKDKCGNLPLMGEYDASYWLGISVRTSTQHNPDDYLGDKIDVLFVNN